MDSDISRETIQIFSTDEMSYFDALEKIQYDERRHPVFLAFHGDGSKEPVQWRLVIWDREEKTSKYWWHIHRKLEQCGPGIDSDPEAGLVWDFYLLGSNPKEFWENDIWGWVSLGFAYSETDIEEQCDNITEIGQGTVWNLSGEEDDPQSMMAQFVAEYFDSEWVLDLKERSIWQIEGQMAVLADPLLARLRADSGRKIKQNISYSRGAEFTKKYGQLKWKSNPKINGYEYPVASSGHSKNDVASTGQAPLTPA